MKIRRFILFTFVSTAMTVNASSERNWLFSCDLNPSSFGHMIDGKPSPRHVTDPKRITLSFQCADFKGRARCYSDTPASLGLQSGQVRKFDRNSWEIYGYRPNDDFPNVGTIRIYAPYALQRVEEASAGKQHKVKAMYVDSWSGRINYNGSCKINYEDKTIPRYDYAKYELGKKFIELRDGFGYTMKYWLATPEDHKINTQLTLKDLHPAVAFVAQRLVGSDAHVQSSKQCILSTATDNSQFGKERAVERKYWDFNKVNWNSTEVIPTSSSGFEIRAECKDCFYEYYATKNHSIPADETNRVKYGRIGWRKHPNMQNVSIHVRSKRELERVETALKDISEMCSGANSKY